MRTRKIIRTVHLWLGLLLGGLFAATAGSGAVLVFRHEVDRAIAPDLYRATPGRHVGFDRALASAVRAFPGRAVAVVESPSMPRANGVYVVRLVGEPEVAVHVDPGTGSVLGWRRPADDPLEQVFRFHSDLLAGGPGSSVVGVGGIFLLAMIATGLRLWWPGPKKLALGLAIRRGRGRFLLNYDLHRVVGLATAPVLTLIVVTGVLLSFPALADRLIYGRTLASRGPTPPQGESVSPTSEGVRLRLEEMRQTAEAAVPGATTISLMLPKGAYDPVRVRLRAPSSPHPNGRSFVHLDPQTGRVLWARDERRFFTAESVRSIWLYPLHIGTYGGTPSRAVHLLIGLVPAVLLATGLAIRRQHVRSEQVAGKRFDGVRSKREVGEVTRDRDCRWHAL